MVVLFPQLANQNHGHSHLMLEYVILILFNIKLATKLAIRENNVQFKQKHYSSSSNLKVGGQSEPYTVPQPKGGIWPWKLTMLQTQAPCYSWSLFWP